MDFWSTYQQWEMGKAEAKVQQHAKEARADEAVKRQDQARQNARPSFVQLVLRRMVGEAQQVLPAHRTDHVRR